MSQQHQPLQSGDYWSFQSYAIFQTRVIFFQGCMKFFNYIFASSYKSQVCHNKSFCNTHFSVAWIDTNSFISRGHNPKFQLEDSHTMGSLHDALSKVKGRRTMWKLYPASSSFVFSKNFFLACLARVSLFWQNILHMYLLQKHNPPKITEF